MSVRFFSIWALILFSAIGAQAETESAEQWTEDSSKQHPPEAAANRIIKWCADKGSKERFASSNLELKGYHPCGELKTEVACDPSGKRMIAKNPADFPYAYKDCSSQPRIILKNYPEKVEVGSMPTAEPEPMNASEQAELRSSLEELKHRQDGSPEVQLEQAMNQLLLGLVQEALGGTQTRAANHPEARVGKNSAKARGGERSPAGAEPLEFFLRSASPAEKAAFKKVFGN